MVMVLQSLRFLSHVASINKEYLNYPIGEPLPGIKCLIDLKEPENQSEGELYLVGSQEPWVI